ncbi:uncharacterized protein LOC117192344 [Drosophila miranda]|uniref:uncharacterized protein LOC117192344 n=1 Tax=Drosophila miranda TaxID=7229 RepID=UPI00143F81A0|nr:uncharacterized protein LOC117192344 [Drosophila miranda]
MTSKANNIALEELKKKRSCRVKGIRLLADRLEAGDIPLVLTELECRLETLMRSIDTARELQEKIEDIDIDDEFEVELEELSIVTKAKLMSLICALKTADETIPAVPAYGGPTRARLPKLALPQFSGNFSDFKNFIGLFETLVHNDQSIPIIEKFNHLLSCLSGEALGTVRAFQVTETNYEKAMASLKRVYDNDCLIFKNHIDALFSLPKMTQQSASSLRNLIDTASSIYGSLLSIGDDKKISNAMIIHLVLRRVDPVTKEKWEEQLDYDKLPLWTDCEKLLNRRHQHLSAENSDKPKQEQKAVPSKTHNRSSFATAMRKAIC